MPIYLYIWRRLFLTHFHDVLQNHGKNKCLVKNFETFILEDLLQYRGKNETYLETFILRHIFMTDKNTVFSEWLYFPLGGTSYMIIRSIRIQTKKRIVTAPTQFYRSLFPCFLHRVNDCGDREKTVENEKFICYSAWYLNKIVLTDDQCCSPK